MKMLTIVVEQGNMEFQPNADTTIAAMYNPNRLTLTRNARWEDQRAAKRDNPEIQFTGADPSTLAIDLFFDTYDTPDATKKSVRRHTDKLRQLTTVEKHGDKHRPPVCRLQWGDDATFFQGVLTQIETQFTLFMDNGTPVRATNRCTFKQWVSNVTDLQRQNLLSSDLAKVWLVKQGETLATIAAREYNDPREWRAIAEANGMDDPLALQPGMRLVLPPRRLSWRRPMQP